MIYGIGTDICDVRRIRASWEKHGERFVRRILSDVAVSYTHLTLPTILLV